MLFFLHCTTTPVILLLKPSLVACRHYKHKLTAEAFVPSVIFSNCYIFVRVEVDPENFPGTLGMRQHYIIGIHAHPQQISVTNPPKGHFWEVGEIRRTQRKPTALKYCVLQKGRTAHSQLIFLEPYHSCQFDKTGIKFTQSWSVSRNRNSLVLGGGCQSYSKISAWVKYLAFKK